MGSGEEVRAKNGKEKVRKRVRFRGQQKGSTHWGDIISEVLKEDSNSHLKHIQYIRPISILMVLKKITKRYKQTRLVG